MSSNVWRLFRIQLVSQWRGSAKKFKFKGKLGRLSFLGKWGRALGAVLVLVVMGLVLTPLVLGLVQFYSVLCLGGQALGQSHLALTVAFVLGQLVCLVFGIFSCISTFYFSRDLQMLVPLPLRASEITLSKFLTIVTGQYLTLGVLVGPALWVYGTQVSVGLSFILGSLAVFLLLPVVPLVIAALFSMLLMRMTAFRRHRDFLRVAGGFVGLAFAIGIQFLNGFQERMNASGDPNLYLQEVLMKQDGLIQLVGRWSPNSVWASQVLQEGPLGSKIIPFLLFVGITVVAILALVWLSERMFLDGLAAGQEGQSRGVVLTREQLAQQAAAVSSPFWALFWREVRLLNRTPAFLMTGLSSLVMILMIMGISFFKGAGDMRQITAALAKFRGAPMVAVVGILAAMMLSNIIVTGLAASAISREGRHFWISRTLPVAPRVQILAKVVHNMVISELSVPILLVVLYFLQLLTPLTLLYVAVGGTLGGLAVVYTSLIVDVWRPHLDWTDPQMMMKGNWNGFLAWLGAMVLLAAVLGAAVGMERVAPALMGPTAVLVTAIAAGALAKLTAVLADRSYARYEG